MDDPPDWDRPSPFDDPPDWDRPTPLHVLTGATGKVKASFWDPPDWDKPSPTMTVEVGRSPSLNVVVDADAVGKLTVTDSKGTQYKLVAVER